MDLVLWVQAFVLGVVEGLTEFLPISSTGHLIVVGDAMGFTGERADTFQIFIQLGAILGVVWHYRATLAGMALHAGRPSERGLILNLALAFLPAALMGFVLRDVIRTYLFGPITVALALIAGGFAIFAIERWCEGRHSRVDALSEVRPTDALLIGIAQCFSLFPGVSRAGATIMGGLLRGLSRTAATEFSFFLAIPTMAAATLFDLWQSRDILAPEDVAIFAVGFVTAFFTALLVVRLFLAYVSRRTFRPFAWYRIGFGILVLVYFLPMSDLLAGAVQGAATFVDIFVRLDFYLETFLEQYGTWVYLLLFVVVFAETGLVVTPLLPGDSLLFVAGTLAATGEMDVTRLIMLLIFAAVLGDTVNYQIGAWVGPKAFREKSRFLNRDHLEKTRRFYEKHGGKTIVIARFMPIIRTVAPFVAGVGTMPYARFVVYNVGGGILWVTSFVLAGYFFGNLPQVESRLSLVILVIVGLSFLPILVEAIRARQGRGESGAGEQR
jgi:undecaprenyl-diphosphatase